MDRADWVARLAGSVALWVGVHGLAQSVGSGGLIVWLAAVVLGHT